MHDKLFIFPINTFLIHDIYMLSAVVG